MLNQYKLSGDKRTVQKLENTPVIDGTPNEYLELRDKAMHSLGPSSISGTLASIEGVVRQIEPDIEVVAV